MPDITFPANWLWRVPSVRGCSGSARVFPQNYPSGQIPLSRFLESDNYREENAEYLLMSTHLEHRETMRQLMFEAYSYGNIGSEHVWPPTDERVRSCWASSAWPSDWNPGSDHV